MQKDFKKALTMTRPANKSEVMTSLRKFALKYGEGNELDETTGKFATCLGNVMEGWVGFAACLCCQFPC